MAGDQVEAKPPRRGQHRAVESSPCPDRERTQAVDDRDDTRREKHTGQTYGDLTHSDEAQAEGDWPEEERLLVQPHVIVRPVPDFERQQRTLVEGRPERMADEILGDQRVELLIPEIEVWIEARNAEPQAEPAKKQQDE